MASNSIRCKPCTAMALKVSLGEEFCLVRDLSLLICGDFNLDFFPI